MDSITSVWTALVPKHVNIIVQCLLSALPPLVRRVVMCHGPKTSKPTQVKGGSVASQSAGRSAIFFVHHLSAQFTAGDTFMDHIRDQPSTSNNP